MNLHAGALAAHRDNLVAALSRLICRRDRLRRELVVLATAALVGAIATMLARSESMGYFATNALTFVAVMLAVRDWRRVHVLNDQIAVIARAVLPLM